MIRAFAEKDLSATMQIWLEANIAAHHFIPLAYWTEHYEMVKSLLPQADVYVYEEEQQIGGFIGLSGDYIEGIFVREGVRSKGIGKQLLAHAKRLKPRLRLSVYQQNTRAIRFYQREGFVIQSESMDDATQQKEYEMVWRKA